MSHWIKDTLALSGIDMACFSTHSTRAASCSKAVTSNVPIDTVLRTAGWKRDNVFRKFYHRPVSNEDAFSQSILKQVKSAFLSCFRNMYFLFFASCG